jgi:hypothetical protein
MGITLSTPARNAACDAIVDLVDGGTGDANGDLVFMTSGDSEVATLALAAPALQGQHRDFPGRSYCFIRRHQSFITGSGGYRYCIHVLTNGHNASELI